MNDTDELMRRIYKYSVAFESIGQKPPLFKLTPYEHVLLKTFLSNQYISCNKFFGDLPTFHGIDFELVGKPLLFNGKHIRSDFGVELQLIKEAEQMNLE